jgi:hypothetical protein
MCINRFDEDTITAFTDLYTKIDAGELTDEESEDNGFNEYTSSDVVESNDYA